MSFMRTVLFPALFISLLICYSCSTDFDINAEKKEIAIVYGLLNQTETIQYIKITKAFLGESNALEMSLDPTLSSFGDDLEVTITQISNGNDVKTYTLEKTWVSDKEPGIFYSPLQEVYKFEPNPALNSADSFRIRIYNKVSGNVVTASTNLIHEFSVVEPVMSSTPPEITPIGFVSQNGNYNAEGKVKWHPAINGRVYEPCFRFNYREVNQTTPSDTTDKYVDLLLSTVKWTNLNGSTTNPLEANYNSEDFYRNIASKVPVNNNVTRLIGNVDFIISVGGDDLSIYIDLNKPSNSIVQERPIYTNLSSNNPDVPCCGIFSCRYTKKSTFKLNAFSIGEMMDGKYTSALGFVSL